MAARVLGVSWSAKFWYERSYTTGYGSGVVVGTSEPNQNICRGKVETSSMVHVRPIAQVASDVSKPSTLRLSLYVGLCGTHC